MLIRNADGPHKPPHETTSSSATPPPVKGRKASFHRNFRPPTLSTIHGGSARPGQHVVALTLNIEVVLTAACEFRQAARQFASATAEVGGALPPQHGKTGVSRGGEGTALQGLFPALHAGHPENRRTFFIEYGGVKLRAGKPPRACSSSTGSRRSASEDQVNKRAGRENVEIAGSCGSGQGGRRATCVPA